MDLGRIELPTPWLQTERSNLPNLAGAGVLYADLTVCGKWRKIESPHGRSEFARFSGFCHNCYHIFITVVASLNL